MKFRLPDTIKNTKLSRIIRFWIVLDTDIHFSKYFKNLHLTFESGGAFLRYDKLSKN